jgi:hypothetical protein
LRSVGIGDAGFVIGVDGGEGAELEAVDVGENSGAARGNVVGCEELIEVAERVVDALGGLKALVVGEKCGLKIEAVSFVELLGVREAESSAGGGDGELATATGRPAVVAAHRVTDGIDFAGLRFRVS